MSDQRLRLYDNTDSGNCYKVRLLLAQLGRSYERVELETEKGETRTPEFLRLNPNGRVPLLCTERGEHLAESGAILWYLAEGTPLLASDAWSRAETLQWMFFEQYSHEPYIAVIRHWRRGGAHRANPALIEDKTRLGYAALGVMETHLRGADFFSGGSYGIADIALYGYTHVAHEGGFSLDEYPLVRAFLARVASQPGHVPLDGHAKLE